MIILQERSVFKMIEELIVRLVKEEELIGFDENYKRELKNRLNQMIKNKEITQFQIVSLGNCGCCAFINRADVVIPIKNAFQIDPIC
jgi:hypothetical protein